MENKELTDERLVRDITQVTNAFNQLDINNCQKLAKNDFDGICLLGYCYEHGIGVEKDEKRL
jgi:hypothetical protein